MDSKSCDFISGYCFEGPYKSQNVPAMKVIIKLFDEENSFVVGLNPRVIQWAPCN